jgi:hypothetical protein
MDGASTVAPAGDSPVSHAPAMGTYVVCLASMGVASAFVFDIYLPPACTCTPRSSSFCLRLGRNGWWVLPVWYMSISASSSLHGTGLIHLPADQHAACLHTMSQWLHFLDHSGASQGQTGQVPAGQPLRRSGPQEPTRASLCKCGLPPEALIRTAVIAVV